MKLLKTFAKSTKDEGGEVVQKIAEKIPLLRLDAFVDDPLQLFQVGNSKINSVWRTTNFGV